MYEGLTFALCEIVDEFRRAGWTIDEARLAGGGSQSAFWSGLKADIWGVPVRSTTSVDATALGAALLAGVATGLFPDLRAALDGAVHLGARREPDDALAALHAALYGRWRALRSADRR